jgi:anionic cell wall polymer biosynthesis LytR-Cps2A-Psr (LCP) family protein
MVIFTFRWYLFPENSEESGINSSGELDESFTPTDAYNFTILAMLSDGSIEAPELFVMVTYDAVESRVTFIPIPTGISVSSDGRTLPNIYAAQGGEGVIEALKGITGVECSSYVKFDRNTFINFVTSYGNVQYSVPQTIIIIDDKEADTVNAGSQLFSSETLFRYIMLADFENGESYRFNMVGSVLAELVNQNFSYADSSLLDTYVRIMIDTAETNITTEKYNQKKAALLNTALYGTSPAEYYVPYGTYDDNGGFNISENSITTIRQKSGIE